MSTVKVKHGDGGFFCTFSRKVKIVKAVRDTLKYTSTAEVWYREVSQRQVCVCVCVWAGGRGELAITGLAVSRAPCPPFLRTQGHSDIPQARAQEGRED